MLRGTHPNAPGPIRAPLSRGPFLRMRPVGDFSRYIQIVNVVGMLVALSAPAWIVALLFSWQGYDYVTAIFAIPVILVPAVVLVTRVTRQDALLRLIMIVALGAKLAACGTFMYLIFRVYGHSADSLHYSSVAQELTRGFLSFGQAPVMYPFWSTNFIVMLIAWIYIVIGVSFQAVTVLFAIAGFWGQYFLYRAFRTAFPNQQPYTYAMLVFLLPSIVFWSAPAGKDAIILLGLGMAAYGFALVDKHAGFSGYAFLCAGMTVCMLVRPHIALLLGLSILLPYVVGEHRTGTTGMVMKVASLPLFALGLVYMASQASTFLDVRDFSTTRVLVDRVGEANATGGSSLGNSLAVRLLLGPFLIFRPFPWEVHNLQAAVAAVEGMGLALFCYRRRWNVIASARSWRQNPFVTFVLCYSVGFVVVFSAAMTNLGLLSRQRIMMGPVLLMVFAGVSGIREERSAVAPRNEAVRRAARANTVRSNAH